MPLMLWIARKRALTGSGAAGSRSQSSSSWLQARRCSRLSARNSAAYFGSAMGASLAQDALDRFEDSGGLERFDDEILGAGLDRFDDQCLLPHRAAHEDLRVGILLADLPHGFDPAHVGHYDVHRDQVGLELAVLLDRLEP